MATKYTYTAQEISEITAKYIAGTALEALASDYNKSVASVRMKLVKLGVYTKPTDSTTSAKKSGATKAEILAEFNYAFELVGAAKW